MKALRHILRVEWLVAAFCAWHAADPLHDAGLSHAWRHSPYDRYGWLAFFIWLIPAVRNVVAGADPGGRFALTLVSLGLALTGVIGDLNFLVYCGLAGIIGALANVSGRAWLWLALTFCWMPAFGYGVCEILHLSPHLVPIPRLLVAIFATGEGLSQPVPAPSAPQPKS